MQAQRLVEDAAADGEHIGGRVDLANPATGAFERGHRIGQSRELRGRNQGAQHGKEHGGNLAAGNGRGQQSHARGNDAEEQGGHDEQREAAGHGHAEHEYRHGAHQKEVQHGQHHIRQLLAQQKLDAGHGSDVQIHDGAQFLFPHHGQGREHGWQHHQQQRNHGRHHGGQAFHIGVVAKAGFQADLAAELNAQSLARLLHQPQLVHGLDIAFDGLAALGHGAVEPGAHGNLRAAQHVTAKTGWYLDGQRQLAAFHAPVQVRIVLDGRHFNEIARACEIVHIVLADRALVAVEHGKLQVFDVHADAEADHHHQDQRAHQSQGGPHGIALQLQRLAPQIAPQALQAEAGAAGVCCGSSSLLRLT